MYLQSRVKPGATSAPPRETRNPRARPCTVPSAARPSKKPKISAVRCLPLTINNNNYQNLHSSAHRQLSRMMHFGAWCALAYTAPSMSGFRSGTPAIARSSTRSALVMNSLAPTLNAERASQCCDEGSALLLRFMCLFRGHFDNFAQVDADLAAGRLPRAGGGHEHIHCHLQRLPPLSTRADSSNGRAHVLASYYFDGQPDRTFRERVYALSSRNDAQLLVSVDFAAAC